MHPTVTNRKFQIHETGNLDAQGNLVRKLTQDGYMITEGPYTKLSKLALILMRPGDTFQDECATISEARYTASTVRMHIRFESCPV